MCLNGNAQIVAIHHAPNAVRQAMPTAPDGLWLRDVLPETKRITKPWDLQVLVYPKTAGGVHSPVASRLVIVPGPDSEQRPYFTTLAPTEWAPASLTELYRLRWQVELVFKELKQDLNLERLPSKDAHAVQIFAWASLIALAVSRTVTACFEALARLVGLESPLRPKLLTRALRGTVRLLGIVLRAPVRTARVLLPLFVSELLRDGRSTHIKRLDSFARLKPLLA